MAESTKEVRKADDSDTDDEVIVLGIKRNPQLPFKSINELPPKINFKRAQRALGCGRVAIRPQPPPSSNQNQSGDKSGQPLLFKRIYRTSPIHQRRVLLARISNTFDQELDESVPTADLRLSRKNSQEKDKGESNNFDAELRRSVPVGDLKAAISANLTRRTDGAEKKIEDELQECIDESVKHVNPDTSTEIHSEHVESVEEDEILCFNPQHPPSSLELGIPGPVYIREEIVTSSSINYGIPEGLLFYEDFTPSPFTSEDHPSNNLPGLEPYTTSSQHGINVNQLLESHCFVSNFQDTCDQSENISDQHFLPTQSKIDAPADFITQSNVTVSVSFLQKTHPTHDKVIYDEYDKVFQDDDQSDAVYTESRLKRERKNSDVEILTETKATQTEASELLSKSDDNTNTLDTHTENSAVTCSLAKDDKEETNVSSLPVEIEVDMPEENEQEEEKVHDHRYSDTDNTGGEDDDDASSESGDEPVEREEITIYSSTEDSDNNAERHVNASDKMHVVENDPANGDAASSSNMQPNFSDPEQVTENFATQPSLRDEMHVVENDPPNVNVASNSNMQQPNYSEPEQVTENFATQPSLCDEMLVVECDPANVIVASNNIPQNYSYPKQVTVNFTIQPPLSGVFNLVGTYKSTPLNNDQSVDSILPSFNDLSMNECLPDFQRGSGDKEYKLKKKPIVIEIDGSSDELCSISQMVNLAKSNFNFSLEIPRVDMPKKTRQLSGNQPRRKVGRPRNPQPLELPKRVPKYKKNCNQMELMEIDDLNDELYGEGEIIIKSVILRVFRCNICWCMDFDSQQQFINHFLQVHKLALQCRLHGCSEDEELDTEQRDVDRYERNIGNAIPGRVYLDSSKNLINDDSEEWEDCSESEEEEDNSASESDSSSESSSSDSSAETSDPEYVADLDSDIGDSDDDCKQGCKRKTRSKRTKSSRASSTSASTSKTERKSKNTTIQDSSSS